MLPQNARSELAVNGVSVFARAENFSGCMLSLCVNASNGSAAADGAAVANTNAAVPTIADTVAFHRMEASYG